MSAWFEAAVARRDRLAPVATPTVERIAAARDRGLLPHALLLAGPERLGRELAAVEAAALLTCPDAGPPACPCPSCARVRRGVHPDVAVVVPEGRSGRIRIEQVREVVAAAPGRPFEAPARVWILDGVEAARLGPEAANALLKTLEEPPAHVRFLLLAANPEAVLPTIRSRCQTLRLPTPMAVARRLGLPVEPPELAGLADVAPEAAGIVNEVAASLRAALERPDPLPLLRAARRAGTTTGGLVAAAAAAVRLAAELPEHGPGLARLAGELLAAERTAAVLNLSPERQALGCLLRWLVEEAA